MMDKQANDNQILFTKAGLKDLQEEYKNLVEVQRPAILKELQNARALGDLSENGMYNAAREKQSFVEGRIAEVEAILKNAVVIEKKNVKEVGIGAKVTLETQNQKIEYHVVGAEEVDSSTGRISHESPLGAALLGKKIGDIVEFQAPMGIVKYKIISIK